MQVPTKWRFYLQKFTFFVSFSPTDLVNTKTTIPVKVGEQRY